MSQIVPAVLEKTKEGFLHTESKAVKLPGVERIQVDFADGVFVPNTTLPVEELDTLNLAFHWEAHLMVNAPQEFLDYKISGFKTIIVHYEAYSDAAGLKQAIGSIKSLGLVPGICLKNDTNISVLKEFENEVSHFQLMSIVPGFQGTPFLENTYERIEQLRIMFPKALIEVDGGVNLANIKSIAKAGADLIICGSALVKAPDILEAYRQLESELLNI